MIDLDGAIAVVTGCTGGVGSAIVDRLHEAGATVIGADVASADTIAAWSETHHGIRGVMLDVTDERGWRALADDILATHKRLDILVHNAGVVAVKTIAETTLDEWRGLMAVNVDGLFLGTRAMLPLLAEGGKRRQSGASLITISSTAGFIGAPMLVSYCTSKGGARLFAKACALEFSALGLNIRSNSVHPGGVETPMLDHIVQRFLDAGFAESVDQARAGMIADVPRGRLGEPDDIAKAVRFLASVDSAYMHGSEIVVDGGYLAR